MTHAYDFGRLIKRGFYLSPDMVASGNFGTVTPSKRKKKKKKNVVDNKDEHEVPERQTGSLSAKSAAYLFGAWMKQAQNPGQSTTGPITTNPGGTLSLNNPSFSPSVTVSGGTQGPNLGPSNPTGYKPNAPRTAWQEFWNPPYKSHTGLGTYVDVLDRWYNPWTTQNNYEKGEKGLMRAGQAAMGVGATAAAAAGAIAAAPTVAGMVGGGGTAAGGTAAGGVAAASQTPAGQNLLQRGSQILGTVSSRVGDVAFRAHDLGGRMFEKIPEPLKQFHESLERTPVGSAISPTGVSNVMNPAFTSGDPRGLLPHSVTLPIEAAHHMAHNLGGHGEHAPTAHAGAAH